MSAFTQKELKRLVCIVAEFGTFAETEVSQLKNILHADHLFPYFTETLSKSI